jgi:hypothetical protein
MKIRSYIFESGEDYYSRVRIQEVGNNCLLLSIEPKWSEDSNKPTPGLTVMIPKGTWEEMHRTTLASSLYGDQFDWELETDKPPTPPQVPKEENPK